MTSIQADPIDGRVETLHSTGSAARPEIRRLPREVVATFVEHAEDYLAATAIKQFVLAVAAGSFITFGAMLSIVLSTGSSGGVGQLLLGLGFAAGFTLVIVSGAALFTEINVLLPELYLHRRGGPSARLWRFWVLVVVGNATGALFVGAMLVAADAVGPEHAERLAEVTAEKLRFRDQGGQGWFRAVASGILGNWLVGMAAFLATAARTISSKVIGIMFPIVTFVALGLQHTPANLGYFAIALFNGDLSDTWTDALAWNLAPAALGNVIGGAVLVGALFWYTTTPGPGARSHRADGG